METACQQIAEIETRLRQLGAKLDRLSAKADETQDQVQTEVWLNYRRRLASAKNGQAVVRGKLEAYRAAHAHCDNVREGIDVAWRDWASAYNAVNH